MKIAKKDGSKEEIDEGKLWHSLYYPAREAHYGEDEAVELADNAKHQIMEWAHRHEDNVITSRELSEKAEKVLDSIDPDVALMYDKHLKIN